MEQNLSSQPDPPLAVSLLSLIQSLPTPGAFLFLRHSSLTLTAVLVDASFFLKRAARIYGKQTPEATAKQLHRIALDHLNDEQGHRVARLCGLLSSRTSTSTSTA